MNVSKRWQRLWQCVMVAVMVIALGMAAEAQVGASLMQQAKDNAELQAMAAEDIATLNDPFFQLVLKDHVDEVKTLDQLFQLLAPATPSVFPVDERIMSEAPKVNGNVAQRRAVITFTGSVEGQELDRNLMMSVFFSSEQFPSFDFIEVMAWDDSQGQFNYYKLDSSKTDGPTWKFRGNSAGADLLSTEDRAGTCMECHINGGPVMKELLFPWNHWHSFASFVPYLSPGSNSWPIANARNTPLQTMSGAETLEVATILPSINRFNERRLDELTSGTTVTDAKRLLKPLFVTTEFNLISSGEQSNLHPFSTLRSPEQTPVRMPNQLFLNSQLLISRAFGMDEVFQFGDFAEVQPGEYAALVQQTQTKVNGQVGDANFAWLIPEVGEIDNNFVEQSIVRGLVPREFAAAVLAIDLETPVLSAQRQQLWESGILPDQFETGANNTLTAQVIANLEALNPTADSVEGEFLALLQRDDPVQELRDRITQYIERQRTALTNPTTRPEELGHLYQKMLLRREAVLADANLGALNEIGTDLMMPRGDTTIVAKPPADTQTPTLKLGSRGVAVVQLQRQLGSLGVFTGTADGIFGPITQTSVKNAQQLLGLRDTGIVDANTQRAIDRALVAKRPENRPVLRIGARGNDVKDLQRKLKSLGTLRGPADGIFGRGTRRAVIVAQRRLNLVADGIVGRNTWTALEPF